MAFTAALRNCGVPVSVAESIDALQSFKHISLTRREDMRAALAATMLKDHSHVVQFDVLFDLYWGGAPGAPDQGREVPGYSVEQLETDLAGALSGVGDGSTAGIARQAVAAFGRIDNPTTGPWYSQYEVMRSIDLNNLVARIMSDIDAGPGDEMHKQVLRSELATRVQRFRDELLAETRRRSAEIKGPEAVAAYAVPPVPEELSFLSASTDLRELRRAVQPLARKLATRVAMKRRVASKGPLDVRHTIRKSLSAGGVPMNIVHRHRPPHRPELFILCDVSSSVSRFSRFSLMLTHALKSQFSRVRSFAFIDKVDEVTRFFETEDFGAAIDHMNREADVVWFDGHSDYGSCLHDFLERFGKEIRPKTTVLILGDARNNYRARNTDSLAAIAQRARRTFWLNPEPRSDWDTGDSAASEYAACVDAMVEVRNLRQLERFVSEII